jgi:hypothetical protein
VERIRALAVLPALDRSETRLLLSLPYWLVLLVTMPIAVWAWRADRHPKPAARSQ